MRSTRECTSTSCRPRPRGSNLVEQLFSELTQLQLRRLAVHSADELVEAITNYRDDRNRTPTPFVWTTTVKDILSKVSRANDTLATLH